MFWLKILCYRLSVALEKSQYLTCREIKSTFAYFHATSMFLNGQPQHFELTPDWQNSCRLRSVHTAPEKFESGVRTLKTLQARHTLGD